MLDCVAMRRAPRRTKNLGDLLLIVVAAFVFLRWAMSVGGWSGLGLIVLGLLVLGLSSLRWGTDSRDGFDGTSVAARRAAEKDRRADRTAA